MSTTTPPADEQLDESACWALLHSAGLGRLATVAKGIVDIFPINYLAKDGLIYFKTAPGQNSSVSPRRRSSRSRLMDSTDGGTGASSSTVGQNGSTATRRSKSRAS